MSPAGNAIHIPVLDATRRILVMEKREDEDDCWVPFKQAERLKKKFKYCKKVLTVREAGVDTCALKI